MSNESSVQDVELVVQVEPTAPPTEPVAPDLKSERVQVEMSEPGTELTQAG